MTAEASCVFSLQSSWEDECHVWTQESDYVKCSQYHKSPLTLFPLLSFSSENLKTATNSIVTRSLNSFYSGNFSNCLLFFPLMLLAGRQSYISQKSY